MQVTDALISLSEHNERISQPVWLMGCFRFLCLKTPNINKKTTQKPPEHDTAPTKPQSSLFQQFQLSGVFVSASCIHRKAANDRKIYRLCGHTLGTGAAAALQPGWVSVTGSTAPLSDHQHSCDCSVMRYFVTRTRCRSAVSGRNCSLAKLNLPVLVFKVLTSAAAINGQDKA